MASRGGGRNRIKDAQVQDGRRVPRKNAESLVGSASVTHFEPQKRTVLLHGLKARKFFSRRLIRAKLIECPCGRSSVKNAAFVCGRRGLRGWTKFHKIENRRAHRWNDKGRT